MPDPGVFLYVRDMLEEDFGIDTSYMPDHWLPLIIVGTLDWVTICGWWIYRNTGIWETDEPYKWVFRFDNYEFDPDQLMVFREDPEMNRFESRIENPGIDGKERTEALQFIYQDVFLAWYNAQRDLTKEDAKNFYPPQKLVEVSMYAVFMWILDKYGRDWIYMQDQVFAHVFDWGVAYLSRWDMTLLDPNIMVCTKRPLNSCAYCGEVLWCVSGTTIDKGWMITCNHCLMVQATETHSHLDEFDRRLKEPHCPHWKSADGDSGSCTSTCPHSGFNEEKAWEMLEEKGTERLEEYREQVRQMGGRSPRQLLGQTLDQIVDHFRE